MNLLNDKIEQIEKIMDNLDKLKEWLEGYFEEMLAEEFPREIPDKINNLREKLWALKLDLLESVEEK